MGRGLSNPAPIPQRVRDPAPSGVVACLSRYYEREREGKGRGCGNTDTEPATLVCTKIDVKTLDIFCTTQLEQPVPSGESCTAIDEDEKDSSCYFISENYGSTWDDQQKICKMLGADLVSVHSQQENSFIRRLAVSAYATNSVFLGGRSTGSDNTFRWTDGSKWDYDNFGQGSPVAGQGECLTMDTSTSAGQWANANCAQKWPVACERAPTNNACLSGPWTEGQFITSPGFPFDSSIPCDYEFTVADGKRVEVEIIFLEANSCCDQLVLYGEFAGAGDAVNATLTGEVSNKVYKTKAANTMKLSWNPNGGVNVRGMMITFRGI